MLQESICHRINKLERVIANLIQQTGKEILKDEGGGEYRILKNGKFSIKLS